MVYLMRCLLLCTTTFMASQPIMIINYMKRGYWRGLKVNNCERTAVIIVICEGEEGYQSLITFCTASVLC